MTEDGERVATKCIHCPWCEEDGDARVACTDLETNDEFQVWCHVCWAHGPSRPTKEEAIRAWERFVTEIKNLRGLLLRVIKDQCHLCHNNEPVHQTDDGMYHHTTRMCTATVLRESMDDYKVQA